MAPPDTFRGTQFRQPWVGVFFIFFLFVFKEKWMLKKGRDERKKKRRIR